jgi:hypothetical protein
MAVTRARSELAGAKAERKQVLTQLDRGRRLRLLPGNHDLEIIGRYESHIERGLYRPARTSAPSGRARRPHCSALSGGRDPRRQGLGLKTEFCETNPFSSVQDLGWNARNADYPTAPGPGREPAGVGTRPMDYSQGSSGGRAGLVPSLSSPVILAQRQRLHSTVRVDRAGTRSAPRRDRDRRRDHRVRRPGRRTCRVRIAGRGKMSPVADHGLGE